MREPVAEAGFSLAEMLVALAVTGIAATLLAMGVARVGETSVRATQSASRVDEVQRVQTRLRGLIERAIPLGDGQTGGSAIEFAGYQDRIDLIGDAPARIGRDAPWRYRLERTPAGDLVLYTLNRLDGTVDAHAPTVQGWGATRLLSGVEQLDVRYYGLGSAPADPGAAWQGTWVRRPQLPQLVRINVRFAEGDRRDWPDLVVGPRATTTSPCTASARSDSCRKPS